MEDEDSNESSRRHSWSKKDIDILQELVIENKNLLEGKAQAISDRGKQAEKSGKR
ncbi:hypothetical protein DPMN_044575 [Dreissena polymorpha]|uniref:Uncharacterized protein n=1 Tax=Dreissena polymorpha TaxID=45954 RepID=A0A9D4D4R8_DREPO|nr:hypothetical protein DPMN_044575 [Dreissena polymorpha]